MRDSNKNKFLISVGDLCVSNKYGIGTVENIEVEDCWFPINVKFTQKAFDAEVNKFCHYNSKGQTNSINPDSNGCEINDTKFFKQIITK